MRFSSDDSRPMLRGSSLLALGSESTSCSDASPPASIDDPSMGSCKRSTSNLLKTATDTYDNQISRITSPASIAGAVAPPGH